MELGARQRRAFRDVAVDLLSHHDSSTCFLEVRKGLKVVSKMALLESLADSVRRHAASVGMLWGECPGLSDHAAPVHGLHNILSVHLDAQHSTGTTSLDDRVVQIPAQHRVRIPVEVELEDEEGDTSHSMRGALETNLSMDTTDNGLVPSRIRKPCRKAAKSKKTATTPPRSTALASSHDSTFPQIRTITQILWCHMPVTHACSWSF
jgi:hypothetical protein